MIGPMTAAGAAGSLQGGLGVRKLYFRSVRLTEKPTPPLYPYWLVLIPSSRPSVFSVSFKGRGVSIKLVNLSAS